jgi:hypothetical protein
LFFDMRLALLLALAACSEAKPAKRRDEHLAVVVVFNDAETAVGNDTIHDCTNLDDPPTCDSTRGYFPVLPEAFADLAGRAPRDSELALVTYSTGAQVRMPFIPFRDVRAADFGTQRDYSNKVGSDLVYGVRLGLETLEQTTTTNRVLVVIGDGSDTYGADASPKMTELVARAAKAHVRTIAIVVRNVVSPEATVIDAFAGKQIRPTYPGDLHAQLATLLGK